MGRQVRFWMLPKDEDEFCEFVRCQSAVVIWGRDPGPAPAIVRGPLPPATRRDERYGYAGQLFLVLEADLCQLCWTYSERSGNWFHDTGNGPVVEFTRSRLRNGYLVDGRIWAEMTALVEPADGKPYIAPKSAEFVTFYEATAKWLRRRHKRGPEAGWYVGPSAWRWHQLGGRLTFER